MMLFTLGFLCGMLFYWFIRYRDTKREVVVAGDSPLGKAAKILKSGCSGVRVYGDVAVTPEQVQEIAGHYLESMKGKPNGN